jgi:hypothetical protein
LDEQGTDKDLHDEIMSPGETYKRLAVKHLRNSMNKNNTQKQRDYAKKMNIRALEAAKMENHTDALNHYRGMSEGDNALHQMQQMAGIPVTESRMLDQSGETLDHILSRFKYEVKQFEKFRKLEDGDLYHALFDYYLNTGKIPYGIAKVRDGDPVQWVHNQLSRHLGMVDEGLGGSMLGGIAGAALTRSPAGALAGADLGSSIQDTITPMAEAQCNMTTEGEYCPKHGISKCDMLDMLESKDDVLLARIKSLALIR